MPEEVGAQGVPTFRSESSTGAFSMENNHVEMKKAYNSALRLLALKNYSEKALLKKLQQKE